jgi:hypothetical protein
MPDFALEPWIKPQLERAAARLASFGVSTAYLVAGSLVAGLAALPSIATGRFWLGLVLILLSRAVAIIGAVNSGVRETNLAAAFDVIALASLPFAFALNDPSAGLVASLLLFAMIAAGAASLFADANRALAPLDVAICVAAFAISCLRPDWFALAAYVLSIFCFVAAGTRIALAAMRSGA